MAVTRHRLSRIKRRSIIRTLIATLALEAFTGVVVPTAYADLLVGSFFTDSVLRFDETTGAFLGVFASGNGLANPIGLVYGPDGNLYVTSFPGSVLRYNGATGAFIDAFVPTGSGGLSAPQAVVFGTDGNLYVSSSGTGEVLRYNGTTGGFIDVFVSSGTGGLLTPLDLTFGPDGNLYVAASFISNGSLGFGVLRFDGTKGALIDLFVPSESGGLGSPTGLVFGSDGNLYVTSDSTDSVLRFNGATGTFIDVIVSPGSGGLDFPVHLAFGRDRNLYVSSFFTDSVLRYSGTTGAFINAFIPTGSGGLDGPTGMVLTPTAGPPLKALIPQVESIRGLNQGEKNSLISKLAAAQRSLERRNHNAARGPLNAFINEVQALQRSRRVNAATADSLNAQAQAIINGI